MRIGKWPCLVATFTLCVLLLQRCSRVEPSPADDPLKRRYEELHARTLAAAAAQHGQRASPWQHPSSAPAPPPGAPGGSWRLGTPRMERPSHWALSRRLTLQAANAWPDPTARAALTRGLRKGEHGALEPVRFASDGPLQCAAFLSASVALSRRRRVWPGKIWPARPHRLIGPWPVGAQGKSLTATEASAEAAGRSPSLRHPVLVLVPT